jgi:hypothetical protein
MLRHEFRLQTQDQIPGPNKCRQCARWTKHTHTQHKDASAKTV